MKPDFLNTILKEPDGFSKYVKFLINFGRIRDLLLHYGRKNLVTTIFFEQRIKAKLNTRFHYYLGVVFVVFCCIKSVYCIKVFVVLNPHDLICTFKSFFM